MDVFSWFLFLVLIISIAVTIAFVISHFKLE